MVRIMKSRRLQWSWHIDRMGKTRNVYSTVVGKLALEDTADRIIILRWNL
jgi:hypothetical protein